LELINIYTENLIGKIFWDLTVTDKIEHKASNGNIYIKWKCKCICGNYKIVSPSKLLGGHIKSCGCRRTRHENLSGQKFGRLTFLCPDKDNSKKWIVQCECGNIKSVYPYSVKRGLTSSCGCYQSEKTSELFIKDLTGKRFGRLTVLRKASYNKSEQVLWECSCDCGNVCVVSAKALTSGYTQSCGCLKSESSSQRFTHDITGQKFGRLTVLSRDGTYVGSDGSQYAQWLCSCKCGSMKTVKGCDLVQGKVLSCGCLISKGEELMRKILIDKEISFDTQIKFDDLKSEKDYPLRFDFGILDSNSGILALIEYQGPQHYDDNYGDFGRQQREITDRQKREYCKKKKIPLFEIRYDDIIESKIDDIIKQIYNHL